MAERLPELNHIYRHFQARDLSYEQLEREIREEERPPMIDLPAYQQKFNRKP